jgi:hypothetical protein
MINPVNPMNITETVIDLPNTRSLNEILLIVPNNVPARFYIRTYNNIFVILICIICILCVTLGIYCIVKFT